MTTTKTKTTSTTTTKTVAPVNDNLPNNPFAFEIFYLVSRQKSNAKKVEILQKYDHPSIRSLMIWNFDESVISMLPDGPVPYSGYKDQTTFNGNMSDKLTEEIRRMHEAGSFSIGNTADANQGHSTIRREFKHFYHFIKGGNDSINNIRRESMFINILEGLHPLESEILILVKDKKLDTKYKITKDIVSQAYPSIIWGGRS